MLGDPDEGSVFDRLSESIWDRFAFIAPVRIIRNRETLSIVDYRPTFTMFLTGLGFVCLAIAAVLLFFRFDAGLLSGLSVIAASCLVGVVFLFRGMIREINFFDKATDSYFFTRQFIHRREVIQGSMSQFTGLC